MEILMNFRIFLQKNGTQKPEKPSKPPGGDKTTEKPPDGGDGGNGEGPLPFQPNVNSLPRTARRFVLASS